MGTLNTSEVPRLELQDGQVAMFGYGSLIRLESMERTLGRRYILPRYTCILQGWRRVWNSLYPNATFYSVRPSGEHIYPKNILYLNICRSDVSLNGVVYVIDETDLQAFDKREFVYDRIDVRPDMAGLEVTGGPVWAYAGKAPFVMTTPLPVEDAAVRASYVRIVEKGLDEFDAEFRAQYEASSEPVPAPNLIDDYQ